MDSSDDFEATRRRLARELEEGLLKGRLTPMPSDEVLGLFLPEWERAQARSERLYQVLDALMFLGPQALLRDGLEQIRIAAASQIERTERTEETLLVLEEIAFAAMPADARAQAKLAPGQGQMSYDEAVSEHGDWFAAYMLRRRFANLVLRARRVGWLAMLRAGDAQHLQEQIAGRLREARLANQLTQAELAEKMGVARTTVTNIESGRSRPSLAQLLIWVDACDHVLVLDVQSRGQPSFAWEWVAAGERFTGGFRWKLIELMRVLPALPEALRADLFQRIDAWEALYRPDIEAVMRTREARTEDVKKS